MPEPMQAPPRAVPKADSGYFEVLTKAVFQSGMSYKVINSKWPGFLKAFHGFDLDTVADFSPDDIDRLLGDATIIRNGRKINATIKNAEALRELAASHGSIAEWLRATRDLDWTERKTAIAQPFAFLGPMGAYFFLYSVGENVPPHDQEATWDGPVPEGYPEAHAG